MQQQLRSEAAICKMRPFFPCGEAGDVISETRNKNISNSTNNYFMSIRIKTLIRKYVVVLTVQHTFHNKT